MQAEPVVRTAALRVATNFERLTQACSGTWNIERVDLNSDRSLRGFLSLLLGPRKVDIFVVNIDTPALMRLCLLRWLLPVRTPPIASVDIIFSRPEGLAQHVAAFIKRVLLRKVDLFILYFRDLSGYQKYYGIGPDRAAYVPFKSNSWEIFAPSDRPSSDGEYVLAAGRTKRDFATYVKAMGIAGVPAILMHQGPQRLAQHGTTLPGASPPANVRFVEHDGGRRTWIEALKGARVVVVPILASTISSSGIGTYLDSMALGKALVISDGPATRGIITDEALIVPAGDAEAMAAAVTRLWNDAEFRQQLADKARRYAESVQGEDRLLRDVVQACLDRGLIA